MKTSTHRLGNDRGLTLVELVVTIVILGIVLAVVNQVFFSTTRVYSSTSVRAGQQMSARAGLSIMISEIRPAGSDPVDDGIAFPPFVAAQADLFQVQGDYDGSTAIETVEPSESVTYSYDAGAGAVMRDPGTGPVPMIPNVTACAFTYFDANNDPIDAPVAADELDLIRSVGIDITTQTQRGGQVTVSTRVAIRNG